MGETAGRLASWQGSSVFMTETGPGRCPRFRSGRSRAIVPPWRSSFDITKPEVVGGSTRCVGGRHRCAAV